MRQLVSIALHAALAQRRKAWLRNAATQGVALSSSTCQGAPSSGPDGGPTLVAGAAVQEPLARHDLHSLCSESRTGRVRPRLAVPDEHVLHAIVLPLVAMARVAHSLVQNVHLRLALAQAFQECQRIALVSANQVEERALTGFSTQWLE